MKILFVINGLVGGGAEKLMNDLLPRLKKKHECDLLILSKEKEKYLDSLTQNGIKVTVVPQEPKSHIAKIRYMKAYIEAGGYDLVHANLFPTLYYCAILKKLYFRKIPFVYTEHNTDNRRRHISILKPLEKIVYKQYEHIISISQETQEQLLKWLGEKPEERFSVIPNGVPLEGFFSAVACDIEAIVEGINKRDFIICMIGSFSPQKNHIFMLEVMQLLPDRFKLILLGEGELEAYVQQKVLEKNLNQRVFFLGFHKEVASVIKASNVVVIPSKWEGFGLVAVEAMACGIPVVCSNVSGLNEVIGDVGIKIELDNKIEFANAIRKIINMDSDEKKAMTDCCKQRAQCFDINRMLKRYIQIYEGCKKL
ncbi:MAG: glycosyltransferase [Lachnospiraceae bacterium]|nr:glycosyltransferase [Lachnospiraceae bacterium]